MLLLTLACAALAGVTIAIVALWHRRARVDGGLGHDKALYAAFVADIDRRVAHGDLDADLAQEERTEAGRALIRASASSQGATSISPVWQAGGAAFVGIAAFGLYLLVGHPLMEDAPYVRRLAEWTHTARDNPDALSPEAIAAVLRQAEGTRASDPDYWLFRGRMEMLTGHTYDGLKAYRKALAVAPEGRFTAWSELGEAITLRMGAVNADAARAFAEALRLDPADSRAHYYLGKQAVSDARFDDARRQFAAALAAVPKDDVRYTQIAAEIDAIGQAEAADKATKARIRGMVAALDASLAAEPDNADGWARLLRSYDVLGDTAAHARALAAMKAHFPADQAATIEAKSHAAVGAEATGGM